MAININDNIRSNTNRPLDFKYGPFISIAQAVATIPFEQRYHGLKFGVYTDPGDLPNSDIIEYYFYDDLTNTSYKVSDSTLTRNITINGVTQDLSEDRTWNVGTVTSIGLSVPTGLTVSTPTISTSGIFAISFTAGYAIPTTAKQTEWDTAFSNRIETFSTTGSSGAATFAANVLNIPNYTLDGLGGQPLDADLTAIAALVGATGLLRKTALDTWSLDTSTYLTANENITLSGDATGSGTTAITVTLANSGVSAGTYKSVTVDTKGRVTGGTNPTTLAGYGITDATPSNRTITINGVTQDLSANRTWSVGTVTSVVAGAGLSGGTITGSGTLAVIFGSTGGTVAEGNDARFHSAVTIGATPSGLSLAGQAISLALATPSTDGALSAADKTKLDLVLPYELYGEQFYLDAGVIYITGGYELNPDTTVELNFQRDNTLGDIDVPITGQITEVLTNTNPLAEVIVIYSNPTLDFNTPAIYKLEEGSPTFDSTKINVINFQYFSDTFIGYRIRKFAFEAENLGNYSNKFDEYGTWQEVIPITRTQELDDSWTLVFNPDADLLYPVTVPALEQYYTFSIEMKVIPADALLTIYANPGFTVMYLDEPIFADTDGVTFVRVRRSFLFPAAKTEIYIVIHSLTGGTFEVQHAQVNRGVVPKPYIETTI